MMLTRKVHSAAAATVLCGALVGLASAPPAAAVASATDVVAIDWTDFGTYAATDAAGARNKKILQDEAKYLIGPKYASTYTYYMPDGYLNLGGTGEAQIRYPGMSALTGAVALKLGVWNSPNLTSAGATIRTKNLIRTLAARHRANNTDTTTRWGQGWQTPLWAYYDGLAAWLLWDQLSTDDRTKVAKMLESEADRLITGNDTYLVGTSGNLLYQYWRNGSDATPGDSKAEENSWDAGLLSLAAAMMPGHANAAAWTKRNNELLLSAAASPADMTNTTVVNGINPSTWLKGYNIQNDGTLQNHSRLHPLYMTSFDQSLDQAPVYGLADKCAPTVAKHNLTNVYDALVDKQFTKSDGTTSSIYVPNSATIYYPEGNDWGTTFAGYFGAYDLQNSLYGLDSLVSVKASVWEQRHNDAQLALQARFTDGHTYANSTENSYGGREERIGGLSANSYLALFLAKNSQGNQICWN
jgi:hypothetical protein